MQKIIGFVLFWVGIGMLIMLLISSKLLGIFILVGLILIGYHLYFCK